MLTCCIFAPFLIVSPTPRFFKRFNYFHDIIHFSIWDYQYSSQWHKFLLIAAFVADTAAVNPDGTKTFLANGVNAFFINDFKISNELNDPNILLKIYPPNFIIIKSWIFENYILYFEQFTKAAY